MTQLAIHNPATGALIATVPMDTAQTVGSKALAARAAQTKFEDIAAKAGIPFILITAVDAQGKDKNLNDVDVPHKTEVLQATFASDVGVENDAVSLDNGYVWYEVREVVPSAIRPLDAPAANIASWRSTESRASPPSPPASSASWAFAATPSTRNSCARHPSSSGIWCVAACT